MKNEYQSAVLAFPPAQPAAMAAAMYDKLCYHADAWDVAQDLANGIADIVVIDTRSFEHYCAGHIPGAISLPHKEMTPERLSELDNNLVYIALDFPQFSGHASITPQEEKYDAGDDHGEENSAVQH